VLHNRKIWTDLALNAKFDTGIRSESVTILPVILRGFIV